MPHTQHDAKLLSSRAKLSRGRLAVYGGLTALVGIVIVAVIFAAAASLAVEAENGSVGGTAKVVTVTGASGGKAVQFGSGATPTPTPTTTPTSTPSSGWPNASNTGVPAGTTLTSSGSITITKSGTVISGLDVNGSITVSTSNVTIKNTRVHGKINSGYNGYTGIVIQDVEVIGPGTDDGATRVPLVGAEGYSCIRCNVHSGNSGFEVSDNVTIQDSYIHDIGPNSGVHKTDIGSNAANHVVVRHNSMDCAVSGCSAALSIYGDFGQPNDWVVDNNLFNTTGSYCVYAGSVPGKKFPVATNVRFTNNHFGRLHYKTCGQYGPATAYQSGSGNVWTGNVWDDTGATITPTLNP